MAVDVPQLASAHDDARRDRARATWPAFWVSAVITLVGLLESALLLAGFLGAIPALEYRCSRVRDEYVELCELILSKMERDEPPDDDYTMRRGTELKRKADAQRVACRESVQATSRGDR